MASRTIWEGVNRALVNQSNVPLALMACHSNGLQIWCCRFSWGLGMNLVAKSDQSTGNSAFASYAVQSGELVFAITAPYSRACRAASVRLYSCPKS